MFGIRQIPSLLRLSAIADDGAGLSTWSFGERLSFRGRTEQAHRATDDCRCGVAAAGAGEAYNEEAFQYLLALERDRFERTNRPFALVLIDDGRNSSELFEPADAARVFAVLAGTLRETDAIGWYQSGRVVGAMLTPLGEAPLADVSDRMQERIGAALRAQLPQRIAERLQVRLYHPLERLGT
jgi:hypothetical protein